MKAVKPASRPAILICHVACGQSKISDRTIRFAGENSNKRLESVDKVIIRKVAFAVDLKPINSIVKATTKQVNAKPGINENVKFVRVPSATETQKSALEL